MTTQTKPTLFLPGQRMLYAGAECIVTRRAHVTGGYKGKPVPHFWLRMPGGSLQTAPWFSLIPVDG